MDSNDITTEEAALVHKVLGQALGYLTRLKGRLDQRGFSPLDPFYQEVGQAWEALHRLSVRTHYLARE